MQKTKLLTLSIASSTLLLFAACGGGSSSDGGTTPPAPPADTTTNIVPQKINISIPDGLKSTRTTTTTQKVSFQKTTETIPSRGYEQLKETIKEAERTIKNVKENMVYLNSMMPDIQTACEGTAVNTQCTIPAGEISLTINSSIKSDLDDIQSEFDSLEEEGGLPPLNTELTMGQVLYTVFDNTHTYQQNVVLDLKPTFSALGLTVNKQLETVRWSDDNNSVESISDVNDEFGSYYMHLTYAKKDDTSSFMSINNNFTSPTFEGSPAFSGQFAMRLEELKDANETVKITSSGKSFTDSFNSVGQISSNGGYLNSNGSFDGNNSYAERETFDSNGSLLQSKYCAEFSDAFSGETCSISDETTWHTFDKDLGIDHSEFSEEEFEDYDFGDDEVYIFESKELNVIGGNFADGICELLPPSFNLTSETSPYENSIGSIHKYEEEQEGVLYDASFEDQLNDLKIFCLTNEGSLEELINSNKPTLSIK